MRSYVVFFVLIATLPFIAPCFILAGGSPSLMLPSRPSNIKISGPLYRGPDEPCICINPRNPLEVAVGANIYYYFLSSDSGRTWKNGELTSSMGVWGDPVLVADQAGRFYFFHLSRPSKPQWLDRIVCQTLNRLDGTWSDGSFAGLFPPKQQDKEWAVVNPENNHIYMTWTQFDGYGETSEQYKSNILFSKSTDAGSSWTSAIPINEVSGDCIDDDDTVEGAVPAVGPNGELYVSWAGPAGLVFDRSTDEGETWLTQDIHVGDFPGGWAFDVRGINRCNGLPITACDLSSSPHRGTIYICWGDQRNGPEDGDIWLSKSTNGGWQWSSPIRINDDMPGHQQFLPWLCVDPLNGQVWVLYYDRRNAITVETEIYVAWSRDGGNTFANFCISDDAFLPDEKTFFGDYSSISAYGGMVRPAWSRLDVSQLSLYTALMDPPPGDADGDRVLTQSDSLILGDYLTENATTLGVLPRFVDMDGDDQLSVVDLLSIKKALVLP